MNLLLRLFLSFLKIGAFSFGGGYGMIPLIRETVLSAGWLTEEEFLSLIAVSESTPGPIAVNIATFIGSTQAGLAGAAMATLGVVLPAFFIILLIAAAIRGLMRYAGVHAFLDGVRPCVVGLILSAAITMGMKTLFAVSSFGDLPAPDLRGLVIFAVLTAGAALWKRFLRKKLPPVLLILTAAAMGILLY